MSFEPWFFAGLTTSFSNIEPSTIPNPHNTRTKSKILDLQSDAQHEEHGDLPVSCKIFECSTGKISSERSPTAVTVDEATASVGLRDQVLIFQYRGKFHAVNHECPHRSYPLSGGSIYDIEDFGIVLSAGITCPKHGWAFDLHTGESDKGAYKLKVWDVEIRDQSQQNRGQTTGLNGNLSPDKTIQEVWVRRKRQRVG